MIAVAFCGLVKLMFIVVIISNVTAFSGNGAGVVSTVETMFVKLCCRILVKQTQ